MSTGPRLTPLLFLLHIVYNFDTVLGGTCWSAMVRNGKCTELISESSTKEECCARFGIATAWSGEHHDPGALFFWRVLGGGVPCTPCKETCTGVDCGKDRVCVVKGGRPRCICAPKCGKEAKHHPKGAVCGTDGRSYRNVCRLKKRACRRRNSNLSIAYYGFCQSSCDNIKCPSGKHCLLDQNLSPHCVKCTRKCPAANPVRRRVCGADGITYPSTCHLREKACRHGAAIPVAYKGACRAGATCKKIRCRDGQTCLQDPVAGTPRCVTCLHHCKPRHMYGPICGSNNSTYTSWCTMMQDSCSKRYVIETKYSGKCLNNDLY
ncbi:follistatin isoform X1 [Atheta coriaria]|uniref:follistatin isoform X1 n=1 Tax=Dalotia coriaria TaxID=877792 RepID=UPI0031F43111